MPKKTEFGERDIKYPVVTN